METCCFHAYVYNFVFVENHIFVSIPLDLMRRWKCIVFFAHRKFDVTRSHDFPFEFIFETNSKHSNRYYLNRDWLNSRHTPFNIDGAQSIWLFDQTTFDLSFQQFFSFIVVLRIVQFIHSAIEQSRCRWMWGKRSIIIVRIDFEWKMVFSSGCSWLNCKPNIFRLKAKIDKATPQPSMTNTFSSSRGASIFSSLFSSFSFLLFLSSFYSFIWWVNKKRE